MHRVLGIFLLAAGGCGEADPTSTASGTPATSSTPPASPATVSRIMPLGDSITQADAEHDSYRRPLFHALQAAGLRVDFVGSQRENHRGLPPHPDFDLDHEGHWGWRVDEILERLPDWIREHQPDVLLVHLGSNDLFQRQSVDGTLEELALLVDSVRAHQPGATFLIAKILSTTTEAANRRIRELNDRLPALAAEKTTESSPVLVVDQHTGFDASRMTYDGVHPNEEGEAHLAERFFAALEDVIP